MATSSLGSDLFAIFSLLAIAILVLLAIRHYLPLRKTPAHLFIPVFLALALPCSIILLVPIDLASTDDQSTEHSRGVWLPPHVVLVTWRITYWLTFVLTWFILPFLGEYCDSGYREVKDRAIYSLRVNVRYQLIGLAIGTAGLVYFILENGFHIASIKGLIIALAYSYGLILAIGLMGHGLVALPRRLYKNAWAGERLKNVGFQALKIKDKMVEATDSLNNLEEVVIQLKRHKGGASMDQQEWIDELADISSLIENRSRTSLGSTSNPTIPGVVTDRYLADLTRKLKRARHKTARFTIEWHNLCDEAQKLQSIQNATSIRKLEFSHSRSGTLLARLDFMTPSTRFYLHRYALPCARIALAGLFAFASVMVIWSEIVTPFLPWLSVIGVTVVHYPNSAPGGKVGFAGQLIAGAWLLYMDISTLYAISDVKVWGNRALVKRQTYAESACWYSLQVAKLTVPLSFNFITLLPPAVYQDTNFFKFLGQLIDLTPLGKGFSTFFPCILLIPVLATTFNVYGKIQGYLGVGLIEDDNDDERGSPLGIGGWREGLALISQDLQSRDLIGSATQADRTSASFDLERAPRTSFGQSRAPQGAFRPQAPSANTREANRNLSAVSNQQDDDDESPRHFYHDFTERVRNTIDTIEAPAWAKNIGSGFTAPKWMQRDSSGSQGNAAGLSRWFGGRPEDGRVRL
jgi:hypothetical protein